MMKNLLVPDFVFGSRREITVEFLESRSIRGLILDIDNTLAPYEQPEPDEDLLSWFDLLKEAGIRVCLVSNNGRERVELFNRCLGLPAFWDCRKPSKKAAKRALEAIGTDKNETLVVGDQIFTDVVMAHAAGMRAVKVPPIKDKKTLFFRFKRFLEIIPMKIYEKRTKKTGDNL